MFLSEMVFIIAILEGVLETFSQIIADFDKALGDLLAAFPNPLSMLNVVFGFITGIPGRLATIPLSGLERETITLLDGYKLRHKVMTAEMAVRLPFRAYEEFVRTITFSTDSTFLGWIAQVAARFTWTFIKRIKFLLKVLKVQSLEELAQLYFQSFVRRALFFRIVLSILGIFIVVVWAGAQLLVVGIALMFVSGAFEKLLLSQDSKRIFGRQKPHQFRINRVKGPDDRATNRQ